MRFKKIKPELRITPKLSKHCLGTLVTDQPDKLFDGDACVEAIQAILEENKVVCLGQQLHKFSNNSYTLMIALAESHISIHTWPERLTVQLDVFLCNYMNDNTQKCENIYKNIVDYFEATDENTTYIERL
ncbi:MAG: adenosylmethionine decarboxylase [Candidatus Saccharibacteria bacterium]|nr:adenosylmethionine decarboxylase [Candidatus Saccharibacteria bacterium]